MIETFHMLLELGQTLWVIKREIKSYSKAALKEKKIKWIGSIDS